MTLIEQLALQSGKKEEDISKLLSNAPNKYKVYTIPKRVSGHRVIAQPTKELKQLQRNFMKMQNFPVSDVAMAYQKGLSIKDNALAHKSNPYLLKLDLENFFNSITAELFWRVWESTYPLPSLEDKKALSNLLFWSPGKKNTGPLILSIGAPTSPLISNYFMYKFDSAMSEVCISKEIVYTRYADDLTFSTKIKNILSDIPELTKEMLDVFFGGLVKINNKKTKFSSKAHNRHVTGVTISSEGNLSLGRNRKRYIKHLIHQVKVGEISNDEMQHLRGLLAFAKHIEPEFIISLGNKYSVELMSNIIGGWNGKEL